MEKARERGAERKRARRESFSFAQRPKSSLPSAAEPRLHRQQQPKKRHPEQFFSAVAPAFLGVIEESPLLADWFPLSLSLSLFFQLTMTPIRRVSLVCSGPPITHTQTHTHTHTHTHRVVMSVESRISADGCTLARSSSLGRAAARPPGPIRRNH